MFNKRKIKKWFNQGQLAWVERNHQQAVYFFKLVIETSIKHGGIRLNDCFSSLVLLGDIYSEERCFEEAELLYRMAAGMDFSAKFVLLKKELFHDESNVEIDIKQWLKKNMIDFTDVIQARDGKNWIYLIDEEQINYKAMITSKKVLNATGETVKADTLWSYEDYIDTPSIS
ncbi:hypothetical protein ACWOC1_13950 [Enterococcus quebecensis]|uniref:Uncharacterized protein n=1 Tax=Enterococcus quebecensis TaxID=903983 RepID=A0A1E5GWF7_9ENTE|nr:hypothetical protein [Enterococcus quebecensis]OEG16989.1 hypothetical protein BCR23_02985 [Enterococcus quebecensis]